MCIQLPSYNCLTIYPCNFIGLPDLPIEKIKDCMGDPEADVENDVLKIEQDRQVHTCLKPTFLFLFL